ncbi:uncharacterized protein LOC142024359 [Carettochelys insculpta]|uniref:uncharacterized protein LOC142024359 n=1 Tax=Carettochelys insculpta TaxID=44489 RepID=UPI003EBBC392
MAHDDRKSQELVKAELSVCKAKDVRKETELRMKCYANWEEFLMPAPISIAILGQLVFISAAQKDFSINKNPPKDGFKHVKYPESFKACLCQDMETVSALLPSQLKNMKAMADECRDLAQKVQDEYSGVISLIGELMEGCLNAKKSYEDDLKDIEIALEQARIKEKAARKAQEMAEQYHSQMGQKLNECFDEYKEAMKAIPTGWTAVGMAIVESLTTWPPVVPNMVSKILRERKGRGGDDSEHYEDGSIISTCNIFTKSEMLLTFATKLKELTDEFTSLNMKEVVSEESGEIRTNWLKTMFLEMKSSIEKEKACEPKEKAQEICASGIRICEQLAKMALSENLGKEAEKSLLEEIKHLYKTASEFDTLSKSSLGSPAFSPKAPNLGESKQKLGGGCSAIQNAHLKVEQSRAMLKETREEYHRSVENVKKQNDELMELMCTMAKCEVQHIDFDTARTMLIEGLKALGKVKEQWAKMVRFFQMISNLIACCLSRDISEFVSYVSDVHKIGNYSSKSFVIDTIYTQAFNASNVAHLVHMISETYTEVSNKYLMDRVSSLGRLIALEPNSLSFISEREALQRGCEEAHDAIYKLVVAKKEDFDRSVEARVETIDRDLKALLPPVSMEEQKAIEGAVRQGMQELTAEEEDQYI